MPLYLHGKYYENLNGVVTDITDQIPFDIPKSWQWVRLSTIFNITMGQSPDGNFVVENGTGIEFHQGKIEFKDIHLGISRFTTTKPTKIATPNSLLLCVRAPVGVLNITQREICIGRGLCALKPYLVEFSTYLWFYFLSTYKSYFEKKATGSTFTAISNEIIKNTIVPLPPTEEQKRILKQILLIFQSLN